MANTEWLKQIGAMDRNTWPALLDKTIDEMWEMKDEVPGMNLAQFFDVENISGMKTFSLSYVTNELPLPRLNSDGDAMPYVTAAPGRTQSFTVQWYRLAVRAFRDAFETDRFDEIMFSMSGLTQSPMRMDEYKRAAILDAAFSGTAGDDLLPVCSNSHPNEDSETGTWDNLSTGVLSEPNLHTARLLMERMTGAKGNPFDVTGQVVLITPENEQQMIILTKTDRKPNTAIWDVNALLPEFGYVKNKYTSDTDAFFVFGNLQGRQKGLHEVQLADWDLSDNSPQNVDVKIDRRIRGAKVFGFTHSRNIVGSAGA